MEVEVEELYEKKNNLKINPIIQNDSKVHQNSNNKNPSNNSKEHQNDNPKIIQKKSHKIIPTNTDSSAKNLN